MQGKSEYLMADTWSADSMYVIADAPITKKLNPY